MAEKTIKIRDLRKKNQFIIDDVYLNGWAKKCGIYATGVYMSLCRHADKEQKAFPSLKKIAEELDISVKQTGRAITILTSFNILKRERLGKKLNNRYYLLDKSEWTTSPISERTTSPIIEDYQSNHQGTDSPIHSKDAHIKDTHKKDMSIDSEINPIINLFKPLNPSYGQLFKNKTERDAVERLVRQYTKDKLITLLEALPELLIKPYAPRITTPYQLEKKMGELKLFISQQNNKSEKTWTVI